MDFNSKNTGWKGKTVGILLLICFLGYYGSITFFSHVHVVDGVTIVHSHPYKSVNGNSRPYSQHSNKELQVIQLLCDFFTTGAVLLFSAILFRSLLYRIPILTTEDNKCGRADFCTYSLRAPPLRIQIIRISQF